VPWEAGYGLLVRKSGLCPHEPPPDGRRSKKADGDPCEEEPEKSPPSENPSRRHKKKQYSWSDPLTVPLIA